MPASSTRAMFGWSIRARACRSASKRAMTCFESMPALMSLTATSRLTGSVCWAIQTVPMPPFADLFNELVRADDGAGTFGVRLVNRPRKFRATGWWVGAEPIVSGKQGVKLNSEPRVVPADILEIGGPVGKRCQANSVQKDRLFRQFLSHSRGLPQGRSWTVT